MKKRFTNHNRDLHKQFSCLDPQRFSEFKEYGLRSGALEGKLKSFASNYSKLTTSLADEYVQIRETEDEFDGK